MVSKISATLLIRLSHGVAMRRGIAAGHKMLELTFNVGQQARGAEAQEIRRQALAYLAEAIPPAGLKPILTPVRS